MNKDLFKQILLRFINISYRWGGDDPMEGYDCSGLVQELLCILELDPVGDQTAQQLYNYFCKTNGFKMAIDKLDTGYLCFYGTGTAAISHIAMGFDEEHVIEAGGGSSTTITLQDASKQNAYCRIRSIFRRKDLIAVIKPVGLPW